MYFWLRYPFVRFTPALLVGIIASQWLLLLDWKWMVVPACFTVLAILFRTSRFSGLFPLLTLVSLGVLHTQFNNYAYQSAHFSNSDFKYYVMVVDHAPTVTASGFKATCSVTQVYSNEKWIQTLGKVQAFFTNEVSYGDVLYLEGSPRPVPAPYNPHEFNYKDYLENRNVFHQVFVGKEVVFLDQVVPSKLKDWSLQMRAKGEDILESYISDESALGISKALLLGNREEVSDDLRQSYAHVGIVHILAVSGLHLGIIYGFLLVLFRSFRSRYWFLCLSLVAIWGFAMVSGLSPSVVRAGFMFSILAVARAFGRRGNTLNSLFVAGFIQLLISPLVVFDVGFQLSYLAVFGILILFPVFKNLVSVRQPVLKWAWELSCISVAAHVFTAPLVAYYFHNVSNSFLVTNLVAIPFATMLLALGGILFLLTVLPWSSVLELLGQLIESLIITLNTFVNFFEGIPGAFIDGIFLNGSQLLLCYLVVCGLVVFMTLRNLKGLAFAAVCWVALIGLQIRNEEIRSRQKSLTVYRTPGNLVMDYFDGLEVHSYSYEASPFQTMGNRLYLAGSKPVKDWNFRQVDVPGQLGVIEGESILILDGPLEREQVLHEMAKVNFLVISHNAVKNPEIIKFFSPSLVLLDTSNDFWYAQRVENLLADSGIRIVNVWDGAHVIKL